MVTTNGISMPSASSSSSSSPRKKHKKDNDPFLNLSSATQGRSSDDDVHQVFSTNDRDRQDPDQSLITRLIISPLIFVSFIVSLFLVERQDRSRRVAEHPPTNNTFWSRISFSHLLDPEPYQDPQDSTWRHAKPNGASVQDNKGDVPHPDKKRWFRHKKHRKMAKLEFSDAFELRGTVMMCLVGLFIFGALSIGWAVKRAFNGILW